jgi:ethylbenzene dioxygenase subunit alpha
MPPMKQTGLRPFSQYINTHEAWIDRRIFHDREIYEAELEQIFARCWLFVAHESQIARPGDFLTTYMGEDAVIASRRKDGGIGVFLNSCPHRGNRICFADAGNTRQFICNYHGWSFGNDGSLLGMHEEHVYKADPAFDKSRLGLVNARVETHKGLVFATFADDAPPLRDYLGDFAWYLDMVLDTDPDGTEFAPGGLRNVVNCNWKLPAENFHGDAYHVGWTHMAGSIAFGGKPFTADQNASFQATARGHGWESAYDGADMRGLGSQAIAQYVSRQRAAIESRLGPERARMIGAVSSVTVFPNLSFLPGTNTFRVWQPKGPDRIEIWSWALMNRSAPEQVKQDIRRFAMRSFSPSGMLEMDDGENWESATRANKGVVTRRQKLFYGMNRNAAPGPANFPGQVRTGQMGDNNQLAMYQRWADLMDAKSWADVPDRDAPKAGE